MQSIHFKWFVFTAMVIVILNALNGGECVEIPVDTCAVEMIKNKELPGIYCSTCNYSRAETPTSAGKEGINLNGGHLYLPIDEFVREHTDNVTCGLKFFVNLPPRPAVDTMFLLYWGFSLKQFSNGSIHFKYDLFDPVATKTVYRSLSVDIPEKDDSDDSDWIELVGVFYNCIRMKAVLAVLFVALAVAQAQDQCANLPDGSVPVFACRVYTVCQGGVGYEIECPEDEAYDSDALQCNPINEVPAPCGYNRDCSSLADGRYTDVENVGCNAYYTCNNGNFFSFNFCPEGLIFNEDEDVCDWPYNVPPPCGTA